MTRQNIQGNEWANAGSITDPGGAKVDLGYIAEKPPFQTENFKSNRADEMLAHIEEFGMPEWDALTIYNINSYALGSDGKIYKSLQNANQNHDAISSPSWWTEAFLDRTTAQTVTGEKTFDDLKLGANADADNNKITTLATPTSNQDAANKAYVDSLHKPNGKLGMSTTQALATDTWETVELDTIDSDFTDSIEDGTNHKITPGVAGFYIIIGSVGLLTDGQGNYSFAVAVSKNVGLEVIGVSQIYKSDPLATSIVIGPAVIVYLSASDYIQLRVKTTNPDAVVSGDVDTSLVVQRMR